MGHPPTLKDRLLLQVRRIQFIADWLDFRWARQESRKLNEEYKTKVDEAKKRGDHEKYDELQFHWSGESDQVWHPVFARQSEKLTAKARKFGVKVPSLPQTYNCTEDWTLSQFTGEWFLSNETEQRLKLAIRTEKRQRDDELRKWATAIFAGLAFVLGVLALVVKAKQPDPCPKNYYRSDSGECLFALQKPSTPQQRQPTPLNATPPNKPSPSTIKP